jgi:hypothetical protein
MGHSTRIEEMPQQVWFLFDIPITSTSTGPGLSCFRNAGEQPIDFLHSNQVDERSLRRTFGSVVSERTQRGDMVDVVERRPFFEFGASLYMNVMVQARQVRGSSIHPPRTSPSSSPLVTPIVFSSKTRPERLKCWSGLPLWVNLDVQGYAYLHICYRIVRTQPGDDPLTPIGHESKRILLVQA